ncbi:MAG TPA: hypothetical protein PLD62_11195, partial [Candidatus Cloacimonadota bacterium]|nr:hypothetical protein [Candidatus Cloacimonadota bacterium]
NTSARDAAFGLESGTSGLRFLTAASVNNNPAKAGAITGVNYDLSFYDYAWGGEFTSGSIAFGWKGIGLCLPMINRDVKFGTKIQYQENSIPDGNGNIIGSYYPYETNNKISVGIDLLEFNQQFLSYPALNRFAEKFNVFFGYGQNFINSKLASDEYFGGEEKKDYNGKSSYGEIGFLLQYKPGKAENSNVKMDYTFGLDIVNPTKEEIYYFNKSQADPLPYGIKYGLSGCCCLDLDWFQQNYPNFDTSILHHFTESFLTLYASLDRANYGGIREITGFGLELSLFDIISYRLGYTNNDEVDLSGRSYSFGLNLMYENKYGVSIDYTKMFDSSEIYGPNKLNLNLNWMF